jgi:hypothetical protein
MEVSDRESARNDLEDSHVPYATNDKDQTGIQVLSYYLDDEGAESGYGEPEEEDDYVPDLTKKPWKAEPWKAINHGAGVGPKPPDFAPTASPPISLSPPQSGSSFFQARGPLDSPVPHLPRSEEQAGGVRGRSSLASRSSGCVVRGPTSSLHTPTGGSQRLALSFSLSHCGRVSERKACIFKIGRRLLPAGEAHGVQERDPRRRRQRHVSWRRP